MATSDGADGTSPARDVGAPAAASVTASDGADTGARWNCADTAHGIASGTGRGFLAMGGPNEMGEQQRRG